MSRNTRPVRNGSVRGMGGNASPYSIWVDFVIVFVCSGYWCGAAFPNAPLHDNATSPSWGSSEARPCAQTVMEGALESCASKRMHALRENPSG